MNIENELLPGEELLYQSKSNPDKVNKHIGLFVFIFLFVIGCLSIAGFAGVKGAISISIFTGIIFLAFLSYFIIMYKQVKAIIKAKNKYYFITNKRIFIYDEKNEIYTKSILEIKSIQYTRDKENYGLLKLYTELDFSEGVNNTFKGIVNRIVEMFKSSISEDKIIYLVGVENPLNVFNVFRRINPNISIYS